MTMLGDISATPDDKVQVRSVFDQLGLPLPRRDEFFLGTPSAIIPLTDFGLVVRVTKFIKHKTTDGNSFPLIRHPHLLRPLASIKAGNCRIDIQPAWYVGTTPEDAGTLKKVMRQSGISVGDCWERNCLYLPDSASSTFPNGFPVCFDPDCIEGEKAPIRSIGKRLKGHPLIYDLMPRRREKPDIQDDMVGHLRELFAKAVKPGQKELVPSAVDAFFLACHQETKKPDGVLRASWTPERQGLNHSSVYEDVIKFINHIAESYRARIEVSSPRLAQLIN